MIKRILLIAAVLVAAAALYILRPSAEASAPIESEVLTEKVSSGALVFEINSTASQVSFQLGEDLRNVPTTVLGVTDQVAGQVAFDPTDLSTANLGVITINARTLATDSDFRDRAIRNEILETDTYEYITFTPTSYAGLPDSAAVGDEITFMVTGDLTIRDITQQVTFEVTATLVSESELAGSASATVDRGDFGLVIPSVPSVANVDEAVLLTITFVADA